MCVSPVKIRNPNYHSNVQLIKKTTDTENLYIYVPCNVCPECIAKRQSDMVQRVRVMLLDHYCFFCTLTYSNECLPSLTTSKGDVITYADITDVQNMMKRIRKYNLFQRPFKYIIVSERGKKKGRPHFHGLIFLPKYDSDTTLTPAQLTPVVTDVLFHQWSRNVGTRKNPIYKPLFQYRQKFTSGRLFKNFDCHYVVSHSSKEGADDVAFYVTKYIFKPSIVERAIQAKLRSTLEDDEFNSVWSKVKSRSVFSNGVGACSELHEKYVKSCISRSSSDTSGLKFYSSNGTPSPLSRYYRRFLSPDDAIKSFAARGLVVRDRSIQSCCDSIARGKKIVSQISENDVSENYPL